MEKINPQELGLLVKSQEYHPFNNKWVDEAVKALIQQRVQHCKKALDDAMSKGEAYFCNHLNSQYIIYVGENGKEYGHFSIPVYNQMIDFLGGGMPFDRLIIQQALRQYLENINRIIKRACIQSVLAEYQKSERDLENALTEMMLVL